MEKIENPGAENAHGASVGVLADGSDYNGNGVLKQDLPKRYTYWGNTSIDALRSHLCKLDRGFGVHHYPDVFLNIPKLETSVLSYEEAMLSHALELVPDITIDEQAGLVSAYITTHNDPLGNAEDGAYIQSVIENVHNHTHKPIYASPDVRAAQIAKEHGVDVGTAADEFTFIRAGDVVANIKPPEWLIKGYLEHDSLMALFGPPKSYKSFLAFDWGCSIATNTPWCDNAIKKPGLVIYIAGEGHNGLGRRVKGWCQNNGVAPDDLKLVISSRPAQISNAEYVRIIQKQTNAACEEFNALPVLFIIDTLARNFGAGDENNTSDMNTIVQHLDDIRRPYRAAMLVVHHSGLSNTDRERGSSALSGALDAKFKLSKNVQSNTATLEPQFMKDAQIPPAMDFDINVVTLDGITDDDGGGVTSVVLEHRGGPSQIEKDLFFKAHPTLANGKRRNWVGEVLYAAHQNPDGCSQNALADAAGVSKSTVGPVVSYFAEIGMLGAGHKLTPKGKAALDVLVPMHTLRSITEHLQSSE